MRLSIRVRLVLAATVICGLAVSSRAGTLPDDPLPPSLSCPGTYTWSSTATVWYGPYATEAEAEADVEVAEQQALDDAEDDAEASCPDKCSPPNSTENCQGEADFDDQTATGQVVPRSNDWVIAVVLDIYKGYDCNCDI